MDRKVEAIPHGIKHDPTYSAVSITTKPVRLLYLIFAKNGWIILCSINFYRAIIWKSCQPRMAFRAHFPLGSVLCNRISKSTSNHTLQLFITSLKLAFCRHKTFVQSWKTKISVLKRNPESFITVELYCIVWQNNFQIPLSFMDCKTRRSFKKVTTSMYVIGSGVRQTHGQSDPPFSIYITDKATQGTSRQTSQGRTSDIINDCNRCIICR